MLLNDRVGVVVEVLLDEDPTPEVSQDEAMYIDVDAREVLVESLVAHQVSIEAFDELGNFGSGIEIPSPMPSCWCCVHGPLRCCWNCRKRR